VVTYSMPLAASKVGDDHTAAPDGPISCTPALLIAPGLGSSGTV
jgi:hypothetical protein